MEPEGIEQEILLTPEGIQVGKVNSVNGQTGDVVLTTSDLENTSDYQTGTDLTNAISAHNESEEAHPYIQGLIENKQDTLTAGNNIQISEENVISATNTTYSAGNGLNLSGENEFSVDTTVVATQTDLSNEVTNRENADIALQQQIDGISASSDVVDIVGTYQDLQNYDTQHLKDNDIIKVLQDSTENNATTYYRWSTTTHTFTLIGQEGPYYTKAAADAQFVPQTRTVNGKALSSNITLNASDVSALGTADVVQTTGTSASQVMSQNSVTNELNNKLNTSDYVVDTALANSTNPVQNQVLYNLFGTMPSDFFTGTATANDTGTSLQFDDAISVDDVQLFGDTTQQTYTGKNLFDKVAATTGNSYYSLNPDGTITTTATNADGRQYMTLSLGAGTYTISYILYFSNMTNTNVRITARDMDAATILYEGWNFDATSGRKYYFSFTVSSTANIGICICPQFAIPSGGAFYFDETQIETGSTATSYEPYVGGVASPNPDYPQDINVVTGTQTVNVHGKNLFPVTNQDFTVNNVHFYTQNGTLFADGNSTGETYSNNTNWKNNFAFTLPAGTYTVSLDAAFTTCSVKKKSDNSNLATINGTTLKKATFTLTEETELYLGIYMYQLSLSNLRLPFQVEVGSDATTYEPYQGQDYTVNLGSLELAKIGTYQDYIYNSGSDWYVHKECGKIILNGTETYTRSFRTKTDTYAIALTDGVADPYFGGAGWSSGNKSDKFTNYSFNYLYNANNDVEGFCQDSANAFPVSPFVIAVKKSRLNTVDIAGVLNWLSSNNTTIYYRVANPTDTQITDGTLISQLNALSTALCYAGETNIEITASGTNLPAPLDITVVNANAQGIIYKLRNS